MRQVIDPHWHGSFSPFALAAFAVLLFILDVGLLQARAGWASVSYLLPLSLILAGTQLVATSRVSWPVFFSSLLVIVTLAATVGPFGF
jgi:hypothetical protein